MARLYSLQRREYEDRDYREIANDKSLFITLHSDAELNVYYFAGLFFVSVAPHFALYQFVILPHPDTLVAQIFVSGFSSLFSSLLEFNLVYVQPGIENAEPHYDVATSAITSFLVFLTAFAVPQIPLFKKSFSSYRLLSRICRARDQINAQVRSAISPVFNTIFSFVVGPITLIATWPGLLRMELKPLQSHSLEYFLVFYTFFAGFVAGVFLILMGVSSLLGVLDAAKNEPKIMD